jgi:hypothetical protein
MCTGRVLVEEEFWREQFADTGGTAVIGSQGLENFTIDNQCHPHSHSHGEWPSALHSVCTSTAHA